MTTFQKLEAAIDLQKSPVDAIRNCYKNLRQIAPFEVTAFGPSRPDEKDVVEKRLMLDGKLLQRASSNFNLGKWLTRLAAFAANQSTGKTQVLEIGTCAGISAMYMLTGLAAGGGGHLTSFEGSSELAELSRKHIDRFIKDNNLSGVSYDIVVGSLDVTLEPWINDLEHSLDLVFIDGNHQEEATVKYHKLIRQHMSTNGIVAHDDIAWGEGMKRAWLAITDEESDHEILEFYLGGKANRGLIFLGQPRGPQREIMHTDGLLERGARMLKARLKAR